MVKALKGEIQLFLLIIAAVLLILTIASMDTSELVAIGIILVVITVCIIHKRKKTVAEQAALKEKFKFDQRTRVLTVNRRCPECEKYLSLSEYEDCYEVETPEEYIYTSVTVGGVTTGGVEKVGGKKIKKRKSGRYTLSWNTGDSGWIRIKNIHLSPEMLKIATCNPKISKYLVGENIELKEPYDRDALFTDRRLNANSCIAIKKWIGGQDSYTP